MPKGKIPRSRKRQDRRSIRKGLVVLPFIDYHTHDIPIFIIASSENMYEIREGFRQLKEIGYDLKILICDESMGEIANPSHHKNLASRKDWIEFCRKWKEQNPSQKEGG